MYKNYFKRLFDVLFSALILLALSWFMLIIAVLIKMTSKGEVIFKQERIGKGGKTFVMYKFRSMKQNSEHSGSGVYSGAGDSRVTGLGRILRATSIDELPQLVNILKGDMSFIGPRPPLTYHPWPLSEYTQEQLRMFEVRPGITGWAQVHGRKCVEWYERIRMNIWYIDHISLLLDLKIIFLTIGQVFTNADNKNVGKTVTEKAETQEEERISEKEMTA